MNPPDRADRHDPTAAVVQALHKAASGTGLRVLPCPELRGGSLVGEGGEGYVFPCTDHGWQVDIWRPGDLDPYATQRLLSLDAAIASAIRALRDPIGRFVPRTAVMAGFAAAPVLETERFRADLDAVVDQTFAAPGPEEPAPTPDPTTRDGGHGGGLVGRGAGRSE